MCKRNARCAADVHVVHFRKGNPLKRGNDTHTDIKRETLPKYKVINHLPTPTPSPSYITEETPIWINSRRCIFFPKPYCPQNTESLKITVIFIVFGPSLSCQIRNPPLLIEGGCNFPPPRLLITNKTKWLHATLYIDGMSNIWKKGAEIWYRRAPYDAIS